MQGNLSQESSEEHTDETSEAGNGDIGCRAGTGLGSSSSGAAARSAPVHRMSSSTAYKNPQSELLTLEPKTHPRLYYPQSRATFILAPSVLPNAYRSRRPVVKSLSSAARTMVAG